MAEQAIVADMVRFRINDGLSAPGYLARPAAAGKHPGVVVIQEWWGLDDHIQDVARRFAQEGYVALAPDLYHGKVAEEPDEARKLAMEMDRVRAVREIGYSAQHLVDSDYVAGDQVGVIGFCMGGGLTLLTACKSRLVAAAAAFYGGNPRPIEQLGNIACPVLAIYGEEDRPLWPAAADQLKSELDRYKKPLEMHSYPGAPHAFFNDSRPQIYRQEAAQDAWAKALAHFQKHLPIAA